MRVYVIQLLVTHLHLLLQLYRSLKIVDVIAKVEITKIVWQIMELRIDLAVHTTKFKN